MQKRLLEDGVVNQCLCQCEHRQFGFKSAKEIYVEFSVHAIPPRLDYHVTVLFGVSESSRYGISFFSVIKTRNKKTFFIWSIEPFTVTASGKKNEIAKCVKFRFFFFFFPSDFTATSEY